MVDQNEISWHQVMEGSARPKHADDLFEEDKDSSSTAFDNCSVSAVSSIWEESNRQAKLVFAPVKRGLPCLNRGYRTPDPSPSPVSKCGAHQELILCAADETDSDSPECTSRKGNLRGPVTPRLRVETEPRGGVKADRIRTPSPNRIRTPSPVLQRLNTSPSTSPVCGMFLTRDMPAPAPPPLCPMYSVALPQGAMSMAYCGGTSPMNATLSFSGQGAEAKNTPTPEMAPSRGSIGHPHSCNAACKYAGKQRGCKDGRNCDHCHLCCWRRNPDKEKVALMAWTSMPR